MYINPTFTPLSSLHRERITRSLERKRVLWVSRMRCTRIEGAAALSFMRNALGIWGFSQGTLDTKPKTFGGLFAVWLIWLLSFSISYCQVTNIGDKRITNTTGGCFLY